MWSRAWRRCALWTTLKSAILRTTKTTMPRRAAAAARTHEGGWHQIRALSSTLNPSPASLADTAPDRHRRPRRLLRSSAPRQRHESRRSVPILLEHHRFSRHPWHHKQRPATRLKETQQMPDELYTRAKLTGTARCNAIVSWRYTSPTGMGSQGFLNVIGLVV